MPKALASLPSARVRRLSLATPIIESSMESRSWSNFSCCFLRNGVKATGFAGLPLGFPAAWAAGFAPPFSAPFTFAAGLAGLLDSFTVFTTFAVFAAGFFALFTAFAGADFFGLAADLAGLGLAINRAGERNCLWLTGKMRADR